MTLQLSKDVEDSINAAVRSGEFASADEMIARLVKEYTERAHQAATRTSQGGPDAPQERKPLWERVADLRRSIPAEEWNKVPTDGSKQLDHYLHGSPKRSDS